MTKELTVKDNYNLASTNEVMGMAKVLKKYVVEQSLYSNIKGKNYVQVEGWQFAGGLLGLYPKIREVVCLSNDKEIKWQCVAEIVRSKDDGVVSQGVAICSNKEATKHTFDEYAILSMAQTRAIGKAYRNLIGWVMKLSGYESTPKEEMDQVVNQEKEDFGTKKQCPICKKWHTGQYPKCLECFKSGATKTEEPVIQVDEEIPFKS